MNLDISVPNTILYIDENIYYMKNINSLPTIEKRPSEHSKKAIKEKEILYQEFMRSFAQLRMISQEFAKEILEKMRKRELVT